MRNHESHPTPRGPAWAGCGFLVTVVPAGIALLALLSISQSQAVGLAVLAKMYAIGLAGVVLVPTAALAAVFGFIYFREPTNVPNARARIARRRAAKN